ncbi:MAG: hypothetical protein ACTHP8_17020 [Bosea sp. (in: a-proteobacteria)]|uniref:hypothetical protein n=1 Tax=Bosea sp. (in: a-proteobacteria) TaxID=1871050 RepID=UPI003F7CAF64
MKRTLIVVAMLVGAWPALADVSVNDAALLTKQSQTAATTVRLIAIKNRRKDTSKGVNCAMTTGEQADITDPTVQPGDDGARKVQSYSRENAVTPAAGTKGAALSNQVLFQYAANVVGSLDAGRSTLQAAQSAFQTSGRLVGTGDTVMAALDMNSAARTQNNLAWNEAINAANLWATAVNALNLARISDGSRAAGGMRVGAVTRPTSTGSACPTGTTKPTTSPGPCRSVSSCQSSQTGVVGDPACVRPRYVDAAGNVLFFLEQIQNAATAASNR